MCRSKAEGGRLCPHNNSDARRLRRKNKQALTKLAAIDQAGPLPGKMVKPVLGETKLTQLKTRIEEIKKELYAPIPDGMTQLEYDMRNEEHVTELGYLIAEQADKLTGFDPLILNKKIQKLETDVYSENSKILDRLRDEQNDATEQYWDATKEYTLEDGNPLYTYWLTPQRYMLMDEEERQPADSAITQAAIRAVEAQEKVNEAVKHHRELDKEYDLARVRLEQEHLGKLSDAYKRIIGELRETGGTVTHGDDESNGYVTGLIEESVGKHYPKEWLEYSNNHLTANTFTLGVSEERANYAHSMGSLTMSDELLTPEMRTVLQADETVTVQPIEVVTYGATPDTGAILTLNKEIYVEQLHGKLVNGKPQGDGWVRKKDIAGAIYDSTSTGTISSENMLQNYQEKEYWVRGQEYSSPKLSLFNEKTLNKIVESSGVSPEMYAKATAYHEFAHRMEDVFPENMLFRQEKAFLARRTGKIEDNWFKSLVPLQTGPGEFAHQGAGFVHPYVGKEYVGKHYEVFSVGIESLYGNSFGGLVGAQQHIKADQDHRAFVLGCLATL